MSPRSTVPAADKLLDQAIALALAELEKRVRTVLRRDGRAQSFTMAMGTAFFCDRQGEPIDDEPAPKWAHPVLGLLEEFDRYLYLTGIPMRIKGPDEPILHDW